MLLDANQSFPFSNSSGMGSYIPDDLLRLRKVSYRHPLDALQSKAILTCTHNHVAGGMCWHLDLYTNCAGRSFSY